MIKTEFSIKDLENLSGVKAHTIRIWEKRYDLFCPERTETNIRKYNLEGLKKLLNVTQLYHQGHKISKIASLSDKEINILTKATETSSNEAYFINNFKTAMFGFDYRLFNKTYAEMQQEYNFNHCFEKVLVPLLLEVGYLWQSGTIDPIHERYISELVRHKTTLQIDLAQQNFDRKSDKIVALFLPYKEIHEIGILYVQYLVAKAGFQTFYLGSNIPLENLNHVTKYHDEVIFMTYLTTQPTSVTTYLQDYRKKVCAKKEYDLWCLGTKAKEIDPGTTASNVKVVTEIADFKNEINQLLNA